MGTGVKQIVAEAGAPFGSIYHFLPGRQGGAGRQDDSPLGPSLRPSARRVRRARRRARRRDPRLLRGRRETLRETDYADACPIATVALEVSSTNEELRKACADVFEGWIAGGTERFIAEGIPRERSRELVIQMIAALEGAFVLCRALRSTEPLELAGAMVARSIQAEIPG